MQQGMFKRVCIVLALVWVFASSLYEYFEINKIAYDNAKFWQEECHRDVASGKLGDCEIVFSNRYKESWLNDFWAIPLVAFSPIIFIFLVWLFSYIIIRIGIWIKTGKFKVTDTVNLYKYTRLFGLSILVLLGLWVAKLQWHISDIERHVATCKMEVIKQDMEVLSDRGHRYIEACMSSHGFKLKQGGWSWCYNATENAVCYD